MRRRRLIRAALVVAVLLAVAWADRRGWLLAGGGDDWVHYHGAQATVVGVIDGDTIEIDLPDSVHQRPVTVVRLWGIDCPEIAHRDRPAEPWSKQAAEATRRLALDATVMLQLEPSRTRGTYGRLLAHVELPDGSRLSERLLEEGLARTDERWPHAHLSSCARAERSARAAARGVWSDDGVRR